MSLIIPKNIYLLNKFNKKSIIYRSIKTTTEKVIVVTSGTPPVTTEAIPPVATTNGVKENQTVLEALKKENARLLEDAKKRDEDNLVIYQKGMNAGIEMERMRQSQLPTHFTLDWLKFAAGSAVVSIVVTGTISYARPLIKMGLKKGSTFCWEHANKIYMHGVENMAYLNSGLNKGLLKTKKIITDNCNQGFNILDNECRAFYVISRRAFAERGSQYDRRASQEIVDMVDGDLRVPLAYRLLTIYGRSEWYKNRILLIGLNRGRADSPFPAPTLHQAINVSNWFLDRRDQEEYKKLTSEGHWEDVPQVLPCRPKVVRNVGETNGENAYEYRVPNISLPLGLEDVSLLLDQEPSSSFGRTNRDFSLSHTGGFHRGSLGGRLDTRPIRSLGRNYNGPFNRQSGTVFLNHSNHSPFQGHGGHIPNGTGTSINNAAVGDSISQVFKLM